MMFVLAYVESFVTLKCVLCEEYSTVEFKSQNQVCVNLQIEQGKENNSIHGKYVVDSNTPF